MKQLSAIILTLSMILTGVTHAQEFNNISVDSLKILLEKETDKKERVWMLKELGYKMTPSNPAEGLIYIEEALKISQEINFPKGIAESKHIFGLIQFYLGDYEIALANYLEAFEIREDINDEIGLGRSYNNIGVIYSEMGELNLAEEYFQKGLVHRQNVKDSIGIVYSYVNLGNIYLKQGKIGKAVANYSIGSDIAEILNKPKARAFVLERLASLYERQKYFDKALASYEEALRLRYDIGIEYDIAKTTINIGQLKLKVNEVDEGLRLITEGQIIAQQLEAKPLLSNAYEAFSFAYAQQGDFETAYDYQLKFNQIQDSLLNTNISKEILGLQAKYQFEKNERQLLEQSNEIAKIQRLYAIVAFIMFLFILVLLYFRYRRQINVNNILKKAKAEVEEKNQQLAGYTKELEQFTYIASHDLKEPLRNISGFARLLERRYQTTLDKNGKLYLHQIIHSVEQMTDLLKDLLKYSEVKRLKKEDLKWIDLNSIIANIKTGLNEKLNKNNGQVVFSDLPSIYSNNFQMTQLFKNFITNGLKFQESGKTPIVKIIGKELPDSWEFQVADNGIGIDTIYHEKIFEMFKRLHRKQEYEGTGMGLAICKQIVEQHNGEIRIESEKGSGTTFIFTFPKDIIQKNG